MACTAMLRGFSESPVSMTPTDSPRKLKRQSIIKPIFVILMGILDIYLVTLMLLDWEQVQKSRRPIMSMARSKGWPELANKLTLVPLASDRLML